MDKEVKAFNTALDNLLTASAALDAAGFSKGSALTLKIASSVVQAKATFRKVAMGSEEHESESDLPEDPWKYFYETEDCFLVRLDDLVTTRARPKGIKNAEKYMKMAYDGEGDKRKPINVSKRPDGKWNVEDGSSTTAIALKHNWEKIPAIEVEPGSDSGH